MSKDRKYSTSPTMFLDRWTQKVVQPDANLVKQLHQLLDMIPNDDHALSIDLIVADLLRFHNPQHQPLGQITIYNGMTPQDIADQGEINRRFYS